MTKTTWKVRLDTAKKTGHFTAEDKQLADNWNSCAIGERLTQEGHPVYDDYGETLTIDAYLLGYDFSRSVELDSIGNAVDAYTKIANLEEVKA